MKSQNQGLLIVLSAPSGAGKSTLCSMLVERDSRFAISISSTSRAPRGKEQPGVHYYFLSKEEFIAKLDEGDLAEWALVHGNYYGTSKTALQKIWDTGRHAVLDIDVQGAESLKKLYGERTLTLFISPPSLEALEARLRGRGTESEEAIQRRMTNARGEMQRAKDFDHIIVNDDIEVAYQKVFQIVEDFLSTSIHAKGHQK